MLMQPGPVYDAYQHVLAQIAVRKEKKGTSTQAKKVRVLYMTPQGQPFKQCMAEEYAKEEDLVLLCGHYEGIDERVLEMIVTDYVSRYEQSMQRTQERRPDLYEIYVEAHREELEKRRRKKEEKERKRLRREQRAKMQTNE